MDATTPAALYMNARRALVELWQAKGALFSAVCIAFPSSHPVYKSVYKIIHNPAVHQARMIADGSVCTFADMFGCELLPTEVDGVSLPFASHWFFGQSLRMGDLMAPAERNLTKHFGMAETQLFQDLCAKTIKLFDNVLMLPQVDGKVLCKHRATPAALFATAATTTTNHSDSFTALCFIQPRAPADLVSQVVAHCAQAEHTPSASSANSAEGQGGKMQRL